MKLNVNFKIGILVLLSIMIACQNKSSNDYNQKNSLSEQDKTPLTLMKNNCFSCHNPDMDITTRVAPPMFKIREHYYDSKISKSQFVNNILKFVNDPTEGNSIMPGAVSNFGLMPKLTFKEEEIKMIAEYIYDNDLESDDWYATWSLFNKTPMKDTSALTPEDLGLKYANATKSVLGKNLMAAIKEKGSAGAVTFCNTRAMPLTDSMAKVQNISIKRVSDKARNLANSANERELASIENFKTSLSKGEKLNPIMMVENDKIIGHYPIETNKMCLQCHGDPNKDITTDTKKIIDKLYPKDKAIHYGEKQIRGIFVVEIPKSNNQ